MSVVKEILRTLAGAACCFIQLVGTMVLTVIVIGTPVWLMYLMFVCSGGRCHQ